jgi:hypothetical protein
MKRARLNLAPLGPFSVRRNPWAQDALGQIDACLVKAHKLNRHLEQAVRHRLAFESDPDVMQIAAHHLANTVDAVKAYLLVWDPSAPLSEAQKSTLKAAWEVARSTEANAKRLRRSDEWKAWSALRAGEHRDWAQAEQQAHQAVQDANRASRHFADEEYDQAVKWIYTSALNAITVLEKYGYHKPDLELSRQALRVYDLLRVS